MCFYVKSGQECKALGLAEMDFKCILIVALFLKVTVVMEQNIIPASWGEWIRLWFVSVYGRQELQ